MALDGQTLRELLEQRRLAPAVAARIGADVAGALARRHRDGRCHGQVSPATVWVDPDGAARLLAPPPARPTDSGDPPAVPYGGEPAAVPDDGEPAAVPYLAPEQVIGQQVGPPADVYALGLVVLEAVTGFPAYPGSDRAAAAARLAAPPVVPNDVPGPLAGALLAMTQPAPLDRPSAERAAARLASIAAAAPAGPRRPPAPRAAIGQLVALGLPVLVLLVLLAVALLGDHGSDNGSDYGSGSSETGAAGTAGTASVAPPAAPASTAPRTSVSSAPPAHQGSGRVSTPSRPSAPVAVAPSIPRPSGSAPTIAGPDLTGVPDKVKDAVSNEVRDTIAEKFKDALRRVTEWVMSLL